MPGGIGLKALASNNNKKARPTNPAVARTREPHAPPARVRLSTLRRRSIERKRFLTAPAARGQPDCIQLSQHLETETELVYEQACAIGLERVVCKLRDAPGGGPETRGGEAKARIALATRCSCRWRHPS